jgi:hypothetical protein
VVLAGSQNVYERYQPQKGIHHFTAGSGGKLSVGTINREDPALAAGEDQTPVALILDFSPEECHFEALTAMEEVVDEGVIFHLDDLYSQQLTLPVPATDNQVTTP